MKKHSIPDGLRQFMVYFIVFFACLLLVLTSLSFEDTKTEIRTSTSMYLGSAAASIASVIDWNYISSFSTGNETSDRYQQLLQVFRTTQARYPNIRKILVVEKTPSGFAYLADSAWGTPEGHATGAAYVTGPANIGTLFDGIPYGTLPIAKTDPLYGSAPVLDENGQVRAIVLIETDNTGFSSSMDRIAAIQFVLLIILPVLVIVTILRSEMVLSRLRKTVRKSEAEYRSVVESTTDSISIVDRNGTFLFMNSRYRNQLGLVSDPGKDKSYRDFHDDEQTTGFLEDIGQVFTTGTLLTKERQEDGRNLLQVLSPIFDPESGDVLAVTERLRDITEQKKVEQALLENEKRYRLLLLNANDTVILFEPTGSQTGKITEVNAMATTMFGYTSDELLNMNLRDFGILKTQEKYQKIYQELLTTSHAVFETEVPTKSGHLLPVEVSARLFTFQDKPTVLASIRDISQRKADEKAMQESLQEKQLLLKEIHHRVKNNLQVIISLLNLQSRYVTDPAILSVITESQHRVKAMALVHEQLYQTRRFAGINFRDYIQSLTSNLLSTFSSRSQKIDMNIAIDDNTWINIDSAIPLGLIISELVTNSMKYAFPDAKSGRIDISLITDNEKYILVVRDNGIGIPEDFAWEEARSLGLRLVRMLTRQISGTITKLPGPGTGFRIEFIPKWSGQDDGPDQDPYR
ncbi:MAG: PAS domain S-box protein [Methanoregula sp.]